MHEPNEHGEGKYMAEIPVLPGCRAWGDTAAEALENLQSVATAFIESYRDKGDSLPPDVEAAGQEVVGTRTLSEVLVAV
ncbi:MAG: type II toxin-antitoxin system HicB family antitoxin [Chloroflexi bacterium]|nr:type II toxin-antitoxin system HicB family antitoxin [Chloroflexota bacterium]